MRNGMPFICLCTGCWGCRGYKLASFRKLLGLAASTLILNSNPNSLSRDISGWVAIHFMNCLAWLLLIANPIGALIEMWCNSHIGALHWNGGKFTHYSCTVLKYAVYYTATIHCITMLPFPQVRFRSAGGRGGCGGYRRNGKIYPMYTIMQIYPHWVYTSTYSATILHSWFLYYTSNIQHSSNYTLTSHFLRQYINIQHYAFRAAIVL
jgi:hypothetical protein